MTWQSKRSQVTTQLDELALVNTATLSVDDLKLHKEKYDLIRTGLSTYLTAQAKNYDLSNRLKQTGELQGQIKRLEEEREKMRTDVETALAREELLRSRERTGNEHTLYLLNRPVRRGMVPYLWALSVLFVGVGILFFYWLSPVLFPPVQGMNMSYGVMGSGIGASVVDVFTNRYTWMAIVGAALIVVLALSLKMAGVFGK